MGPPALTTVPIWRWRTEALIRQLTPQLGHSVSVVSRGRRPCQWALRFSNRAPVGQTLRQVPQDTQEDSPMGTPWSAISRVLLPRLSMSSTWAPTHWSQARMQRPQRMQRLWSRAMRGWLLSTGNWGNR